MTATTAPTAETPEVVAARELHVNVLLLASRALEQLEAICKEEGVTHAQYVALWALCLADDPDAGLPLGAVSDGLLNRASDTTRLVDRMERNGLVERLPNPADRRGVLVRATPEGHRCFAAITPQLQAFHAGQWAALGPGEVQELRRLVDKALWSGGAAH